MFKQRHYCFIHYAMMACFQTVASPIKVVWHEPTESVLSATSLCLDASEYNAFPYCEHLQRVPEMQKHTVAT